ncbi:unnamed protein product [Arabidopsis lyrata]|uniref:transport and Golgi organization protein 2 homolog n=1 Tax=Arabidopsis lyrata subsp. lyrata TaxID=81972 RepID=UPI000A29C8ED|nr:transport and Golgi organization protein 2 homolog [Arabidopsis lyrata subsp. lyrata]CAH8252953.1 unnamed protein product [Arabidopsis lyrata]|eukprot:XP_020866919.1 transport and Golgi organization protein 2 homolog [Arabidopsis lyrata subsp. lyrata]
MGIVAFQWGEGENILTLLQNRENWQSRSIRAADWEWDESKVLSARCGETDGTWLGISFRGRVAFLVEAGPVNRDRIIGAERRTLEFLESNESPEDFAKSLAADRGRNTQIAYHLIVADIASNSMLYISKQSFSEDGTVHIMPVGPGVHTLSSAGLDSEVGHRELRLKQSFSERINRKLPEQIWDLAEEIMYDREAIIGDPLSSIFVDDTMIEHEYYGTRNTTALVVRPTKEVSFAERNRAIFNADWTMHAFFFTII